MKNSKENQRKDKILRVFKFKIDFFFDIKILLLIYLFKRLIFDFFCVKIILSTWRFFAKSLKVLCERIFNTINYCILSHFSFRCKRLIENDDTRDNNMIDVIIVFNVRRKRNICKIRSNCLKDEFD